MVGDLKKKKALEDRQGVDGQRYLGFSKTIMNIIASPGFHARCETKHYPGEDLEYRWLMERLAESLPTQAILHS